MPLGCLTWGLIWKTLKHTCTVICMHTQAHKHTHTCAQAWRHSYTCTGPQAHVHAGLCTCAHAFGNAHTHTHTSGDACTRLCTPVHGDAHTCTHMYTHTRIPLMSHRGNIQLQCLGGRGHKGVGVLREGCLAEGVLPGLAGRTRHPNRPRAGPDSCPGSLSCEARPIFRLP